MPKTYILHRNRQEIRIQQEAEYFTVIVDDESLLDEVYQFPEVSQIKRVFNNVFKIKAEGKDNDKLVDNLRKSYDTRAVFHHAYKPTNDDATRYYITDLIVVNFKNKTSIAKMEAIMQQCGLQFIKQYGENGMTYLFKVTKTSGKNPVKLCNDLDAMPEVNYAEPNLINRFDKSALPTDSLFQDQWHLRSRGGLELIKGADVDAEGAWKITKGSRDVVVAIVDDGFDLTHPDFKGAEKIVHGRDFVDGDKLPFPDELHNDYHGTPCAGVAIAEENGNGIVGIAPGCAFMPVRFDLAADDDLLWEIFDYVGKRADVISCSWGPVPVYAPLGSLLDHKFTEIVNSGGPRGKGAVLLFAAGNFNAPLQDLTNKDFQWRHPSNGITKQARAILNGNCAHKDVMAIAASTSQNKKAAYSNWGKELSVSAPSSNWHPLDPFEKMPGRGIWTTDNENFGLGFTGNSRYTGIFGGTSSATPLVAGIAALVISANKNLTAKEVRNIIETTADKIEDTSEDIVLKHKKGTYTGNGKSSYSEWFGYGKVNAAKAVAMAKSMLPTTEKEEVDTTTSPTEVTKTKKPKALTTGISIIAALINPKGKETGKENFSLLNQTDQDIPLDGWYVVSNPKTKQFLNGKKIKANEILTIKAIPSLLRLTNAGGSITLFNYDDKIVHEVKYSRKDAGKNGWTTRF
jgi:subtilase family protein/fervidolysin-like protein